MRVEIRNRLAEICLAAAADAAAEAPLHALLAFTRSADASGAARGLADRDGVLLLAMPDWFETSGEDELRLRPDLRRDLGALRERAERIAEAVAACRSRCGGSPDPSRRTFRASESGVALGAEEIRWALCAASVLFNAELFFEVHEILEPYWRRADPETRSLLQGLIQVAAGFHHRANGNRRGALTLLRSGGVKLASYRPTAQGLDLESFCRATDELAERLREGGGMQAGAAPKLRLRARRTTARAAQRPEITR